jgi:competence protein ComEC
VIVNILRAAICSISVATVFAAVAEPAPEFIVWNVGQGLWTTVKEASVCRHFDVGGERAPWRQIVSACGGKQNRASFSHWDWDHVAFAREASRRLGNFCIEAPPAGPANEKRRGILDGLPSCPMLSGAARDLSRAPESPSNRIVIENRLPRGRTASEVASGSVKPRPSTNEWSRVFLFQTEPRRFLVVPGDSDQKAERGWAPSLPMSGVWLLVLGHHGSRTATSPALLARLPSTRMAVASARFAKYGHPHKEVILKLKERGIALLRTEEWGTLRFETTGSPVERATKNH